MNANTISDMDDAALWSFQTANILQAFGHYHVEFVVDVSESVFDDEIFHLHASVCWGLSRHHVGYIGHALHAACNHHIL